MKRRILIITNNSGGLFRFRKELIEKLIQCDYEIIVSTPFDDNIDDLIKLGVVLIETNINRRSKNMFKDIVLLVKYFKMLKEYSPKLIITYTIKPNLYGAFIARLMKVQYVINITGLGTTFQSESFTKKIVIFFYSIVCKSARKVYFENLENQNVFVNYNIVDKEKCCLLHGAGVNLYDFSFEEYPQEAEQIRFLFIGRIMKEKGVNELFWAFEKLNQEYNNIVLDIVGNYEDNYEREINSLVDKGIVHFHGYQTDVRPFIKECHCFVLPSYHEGMANTLLESAAMGRPLITTNIHGCKEAVNSNGFLCNRMDKESLYYSLKKFIDLDYSSKKQLGFMSRKHMEMKFDKYGVVRKTIENLDLDELFG